MTPEEDNVAAPGPSSEAVAAATAMFVKRNRNRGNLRKRANDGEGSADEDTSQIEKKAKAATRNDALTFTSKQKTDEEVHVTYESTRAIQSGRDESVFKVLETETAVDRDARALREAVLAQGKAGEGEDDGKYKGMNSYTDYRAGFRREHTVGAEKGAGSHGPLRANMYVRMTALMDYNPSLCKDYKETGYCSYGDSCKFIHDRGDYKQSWELDKDWEEEQKRKTEEKMRLLERGSDEEGEEGAREEESDNLPFACYTCRKAWGEAKNPVVTLCKHYFCEDCALKNNAKSGKCAVCNQATRGIFNVANDIVKKMKRAGPSS